MSFTDRLTVSLFLNKEVLSSFETLQVDMIIKLVDGAIVNYCGWSMLAADYVKDFDGLGSSELDLKVYPINTLESVFITDSSDVSTEVTSDIKLKSDIGVIYLTSNSSTLTSFTSGTRNITVSFNAGFSKDNMPDDLRLAASYLCALYYNRIKEENVGVTEEKFEEVTTKFEKVEIPQPIKDVLNRYKLLLVG